MLQEVLQGKFILTRQHEKESSLVLKAVYDSKTHELEMHLTYGTYTYINVPLEVFFDFSVSKSYGGFYHSKIKNKFMSKSKKNDFIEEADVVDEKPAEQPAEKNKPKKVNRIGKEEVWVEGEIDLDKINKQLLIIGVKSKHRLLKLRVRIYPTGEMDKYGNLAMITQQVPTDIYKKDKSVKGEILGNLYQNVWNEPLEEETRTVNEEDLGEDLPF